MNEELRSLLREFGKYTAMMIADTDGYVSQKSFPRIAWYAPQSTSEDQSEKITIPVPEILKLPTLYDYFYEDVRWHETNIVLNFINYIKEVIWMFTGNYILQYPKKYISTNNFSLINRRNTSKMGAARQ